MRPIKLKSTIPLAVLFVTILFFLFQATILRDLKFSENVLTTSEQHVNHHHIDDDDITLVHFTSTKPSIVVDVAVTRAKPRPQIEALSIPMDLRSGHPLLNYMLPFFHRKNFPHFAFTLIDNPGEMISGDHLKLETLRGINVDNKFSYAPDTKGLFRCLNSNVSPIFIL